MNDSLKNAFHYKQLPSFLRRKKNFLPGVSLLTAALNCLWVVQDLIVWYGLGSPTVFHGDGNSPGFTIADEVSSWSINTKLRIAIALIVIAIAICLEAAKIKTVLNLALLWVIGEYILWWSRAYNIVRNVEKPDFSGVSHAAYLIDGTWWDIWILAVVIMLLTHNLVNFNNNQKRLS